MKLCPVCIHTWQHYVRQNYRRWLKSSTTQPISTDVDSAQEFTIGRGRTPRNASRAMSLHSRMQSSTLTEDVATHQHARLITDIEDMSSAWRTGRPDEELRNGQLSSEVCSGER